MRVKTIAQYLVYITKDFFGDLSSEKLNYLLYLAQGYYLKEYHMPLFEDPIEARADGPVIPDVCLPDQKHEGDTIMECDAAPFSSITPEMEEILFGVARTYGKYTADTLQKMICVIGSPWDQAHQKGQTEIPFLQMQDYFANCPDLDRAEKQFRDCDFVGYRNEDGILVLPKEWDEE